MIKLSEIAGCLRKSKDGKALATNFSYLALLQVAQYFFPLITMPYLGRVLGPECFGILAIGSSVIAYVNAIVDYGFNYTSVRQIARNKDNIDEISRIVSLTVSARFILILLSFSLLCICIFSIPFLRHYYLVILITFLSVPARFLHLDWFFQGIEDMKYITLFSIIARLLFTILVFFFIKDRSDYLMQPILTAFGEMVVSVICVWTIIKRFGVKYRIPSLKAIFEELKNGFNMFISLFLPTIYSNLNTLILGAYNGDKATGLYNGGNRFTSLAYSLFMLMSRTFFPFFARRMDKHSLYAKFSLGLATLISLFFFFFAKPLVMLLLGHDFEGTVSVLRIVAFSPIAMSLMNSYGINYLVLKGKERLMKNIVIFITFFGLGIGIVGAKYYSYVGVAIASMTTQMLRALIITFYAKRLMRQECAD